MYNADMIFQFYEHLWFIQSVNWVCNYSKMVTFLDLQHSHTFLLASLHRCVL